MTTERVTVTRDDFPGAPPSCVECRRAIREGEVADAYTFTSTRTGEPVTLLSHAACIEDKRKLAEARERARYDSDLTRNLPPHARAIADLPTFALDGGGCAVEDWLKRPAAPLWLHGAPGTGKTSLAAIAVLARQAEGGLIAWTTAREVVKTPRKLRAGEVGRPSPTGATLAVLDDAGAHRLTPLTVDRLTAWADALYGRGVPVLVTSNLRPSDLAEAVTRATGDAYAGERIVRRLRGDCAGEVIEVGRVPFGGRGDLRSHDRQPRSEPAQ